MIKKLLNLKTIIFMILTVILLLLAPKISGLLLVLFASYVLAAALNPFVNKLQEKLKNRALAAVITVVTTIFAVVSLILPIIIVCYKEVVLFITIMPQKAANLYLFLTKTKIYGKTLSQIIPVDNLTDASADIAQNLLNQSLNITANIAQAVFILIALTMFVFYILVDKHYLREKFIEFFPPDLKEKAGGILYNITSKVGNYTRAQILSMVAVGIMVAIGVAVTGVDYPVLLGLIAGILDIIPVLGPSIALAVICAVAFPLGAVRIAIVIILFLASQQVSNYVVRPFLFGKFMKLHPITILVAIFMAQQFLGLFGVILSPAIAATICVLIDELYLTPMNEEK